MTFDIWVGPAALPGGHRVALPPFPPALDALAPGRSIIAHATTRR